MRRERIRRTALDLSLWAAVSAPVLFNGGRSGAGGWVRPWTASWSGTGWATAAGIVLLGAAVAAGRRFPLAALGTALGLGALYSTQLITPQYSAALVVFAFLAGRRSPRARPALALFASVTALGLVLTLAAGDELWIWFMQVAAVLLAVVVPWLLGRSVRQYADLVRAGWTLADRLEREQRAVADRERLRERSRIAGDMHDSLGHELSLIALRAAALEIDRELGEPQRAAARELRLAAAGATARLRDIVGVLRTDEEGAPTAPRDETVRAVVERARASGLSVHLAEPAATTDTGPGPDPGSGLPGAVPLPEMTDRAVHRVVQESLTNAARHAPGAEVTVRVVRRGGEVGVTVANGPAARPAQGPASGGTGLVGLHERVRLAGGTLVHGPAPDGGFSVTARLPVDGAPLRDAAAPPGRAPTAARELDRARRRVRRGLRQAVLVPAAVAAVLGLLMAGFDQYTRMRTLVPRAVYDAVRVGDLQSEVTARLPGQALPGRPAGTDPEPPDADHCRYHRADLVRDAPAYRFCFTEGRLSHKTLVTDVPREEDRDASP
ncbi:sensor histidine kinase [Streptomyces tsukubensis]|uniref:histidine kinase n=2 Tax=Streptomyces TaxID=1883 RepID=A0A7G3UAP0_STRT9|nr:histidine kinase [Streptomyces tsukubensis]AZK96573.1 sensor histidine kinase [Streptomyces tsukubensis]QKM67426.1 sensor histidine kinase [Streptomyces tsukubensis NRRL18488]TAI42131.1 sensor histidine kinase [Streptomyces tsukubensis]